jgi:hypothetical protein
MSDFVLSSGLSDLVITIPLGEHLTDDFGILVAVPLDFGSAELVPFAACVGKPRFNSFPNQFTLRLSHRANA